MSELSKINARGTVVSPSGSNLIPNGKVTEEDLLAMNTDSGPQSATVFGESDSLETGGVVLAKSLICFLQMACRLAQVVILIVQRVMVSMITLCGISGNKAQNFSVKWKASAPTIWKSNISVGVDITIGAQVGYSVELREVFKTMRAHSSDFAARQWNYAIGLVKRLNNGFPFLRGSGHGSTSNGIAAFGRIAILALFILAPTLAFAQPGPITQFCVQGGTGANVSGLKSTNYQQGIVPTCTVTVYLTGTLTKATIYSDVNSTPLSNPFTAASPTGTAPGQWIFYAATGQLYDVVLSGGVAPNIYAHPVTLTGLGSGGGGGGGGGSPGGVNQDIQWRQNSSTFGGGQMATDSATNTNLAGAGWLNTGHPTPAGAFNYFQANGLYSALMAQTGGGNNGAANGLKAGGSNAMVVADPTYAGSDLLPTGTFASFTGSISGTTLTTSGVTGTITLGALTGSGVASGTFITAGTGPTYTVNISQTVGSEPMQASATGQVFQDFRGGGLKTYSYNNQIGQANYTWCGNAVRNVGALDGGGFTCGGTDAYFYGLGNTQGNGFVYNSVVGGQNIYNFVPGIMNANVHKINCFSDGDCNQYQYFLFGASNRDHSAEGIQPMPWHIDQFPTYIATVASVADSRHIMTTPISGQSYGGGWIASPTIETGTFSAGPSFNGEPTLTTSTSHTPTTAWGFTTSQCFPPMDPQNGSPCTIQVQFRGGSGFTTTATFTGTSVGTTLTTSSVTGTIHIGDLVSGPNVNDQTFIVSGTGPTYVTSQPNTISTPTSLFTQNLSSSGGFTNGTNICATNSAGGNLWMQELTLTAVSGVFAGGGGYQENITANVRYPTNTGDQIYAGSCLGLQLPTEFQNIVNTSQNASMPTYIFAGAPDATHYFIAGVSDTSTPATLPITFPTTSFATRDTLGNAIMNITPNNAVYIPRLMGFPQIAVTGCSDSSLNFSAATVHGTSTSFTASIGPASNIMTVTAVTTATLAIGGSVTGAGVASNTVITAFQSGTGGTGTYIVNNAQTVGSEAMVSLTAGPTVSETSFPVGSQSFIYQVGFIQPGSSFTNTTATGCVITGSGLSNYNIVNVAEVQSISDPAVPLGPQSAPNSTPQIDGYMQLAPNSWVNSGIIGNQIEQPGGARLGLNNTVDYTQYTTASPSFKSSVLFYQFQGLGATGPGQTPIVLQNKNQAGNYQGYGGQWPISGYRAIDLQGAWDAFMQMNLPVGTGSVFTLNCPIGQGGANCVDSNTHNVMTLLGNNASGGGGSLTFVPNTSVLAYTNAFAATSLTANNGGVAGFTDALKLFSGQANAQGPCATWLDYGNTQGIGNTNVIGRICGVDFMPTTALAVFVSADGGGGNVEAVQFGFNGLEIPPLGGSGVQCVSVDNFGDLQTTGAGACGSGGGGGSSVTVNGGSTLSTANFGAAPAAGTNGINVTWQTSGTNVSAEIVGDGNAAHCFSGVGTWVACAAGTGISGLTAGFLPLAGSSTTLTANSHCDDGITSAGVVTCSEPFVASTLTSVPAGGVGGTLTLPEGTTASGIAGNDICYADSTLHGIKCSYNNGAFVPNVVGPASSTNGHVAIFSGTGGNILADGGAPGTGTVTSIATTGPIGGGTITSTGTITCTTCVVASSPGVGIAHFAGSTQTVTSSLIVAADITSNTITGTQLASSLALVTPNIGAATGTSLVVTGNIDGTAGTTITTGTTATLNAFLTGYWWNQEATAATAVAYTLPTAAAGLQKCVGNSWNGSAATTGVLTVNASASGQFIIFTDGTLSATGGNVTSGGAAADASCFVGIDSTHWQMNVVRGTWTKH